jgi:hypothetical protein
MPLEQGRAFLSDKLWELDLSKEEEAYMPLNLMYSEEQGRAYLPDKLWELDLSKDDEA